MTAGNTLRTEAARHGNNPLLEQRLLDQAEQLEATAAGVSPLTVLEEDLFRAHVSASRASAPDLYDAIGELLAEVTERRRRLTRGRA